MTEPLPGHPFGTALPPVALLLRRTFQGPFIINGGYDAQILSVNAVLFWYPLRENGFNDPLVVGGRLLREF